MAVLRPVLLVRDLPSSWRESRHGFPCLSEFASSDPHPEEGKIVTYLRQGEVIGLYPDRSLSLDVLSPPGRLGAEERVTAIQSDGVWAWWGALAYYVERYHVRLPEEFIQHAEANGWRIAPGSSEEPDLSEFEAMDEMPALI